MNAINGTRDAISVPSSSKRNVTRFRILLILLSALLLISCLIALSLGPVPISISTVVAVLLRPEFRQTHTEAWTIVWQIRLPRILLATIIGVALAASGAGFQSLLRNDLADPYILGISSGASSAVAAVSLFGLSASAAFFVTPVAAFAGALAVLFTVLALSSRLGRIDSRSLLLNGVIVSAFLWALEMAILRFAGHDFEEILNWLMGSLSYANWLTCGSILAVVLVCFVILMLLSPSMNLYAIGEESARQLGLESETFKRVLVITSTILAAASVAAVGIVGFIGLISPHIARRLLGTPDHRFVLPTAALCGGILLLWSDTLARLLFGGDMLPVGIITAFLGAPFFCYQLRRR